MEKAPTTLSPERIRARIAEIDRLIISLTTTAHLAEVPAKNEISSSQEDDPIEGEMNFNDFSAEEEHVKHLRDEKAALQAQLEKSA